ncbi:MAG: hypothetical protein R3D55_05090 [Chloroflexota bacterium]
MRWAERLDAYHAAFVVGEYFTAVLHCEVALIGIQPASLELGETLSPEATAAAGQVVEALAGIYLAV